MFKFFPVLAMALAFAAPSWAGCKVDQTTDPVHGVTTSSVQLGKISAGVHGLVGKNDQVSEQFPPQVLALMIERTGIADIGITAGDAAVVVHASGAKTKLTAFADGVKSGRISPSDLITTWSVSYALTDTQLARLATDPITHIQVGFGDARVPVPVAEKKGEKVGEKIACLLG